jgi:hypothetical protein
VKFLTSGKFGGDLNGGNAMERQGVVGWQCNFNLSWRGPIRSCLRCSFDQNSCGEWRVYGFMLICIGGEVAVATLTRTRFWAEVWRDQP